MYKKAVKRVLDILLSLILLILLSIPMAVVALLIKLDSRGPVFFTQRRLGKNKKEFLIIKFRSMPTYAPSNTPTSELVDANSLISPFGRFIRRYSIDELPQLFNIIMGSMSLVGPRPVLPSQTELIEKRDLYGANDVKPGLTGWAQINGRDELDDDEKARLDGEYVARLSFLFDVKCIIKTVRRVLSSDGVVEGGGAQKDDGSQ